MPSWLRGSTESEGAPRSATSYVAEAEQNKPRSALNATSSMPYKPSPAESGEVISYNIHEDSKISYGIFDEFFSEWIFGKSYYNIHPLWQNREDDWVKYLQTLSLI